MWTTEIKLPDVDEIIQDDAGFETHNKTYVSGIPANFMDATRNDELTAHEMGYRADVICEIEAAAYNGAGYFIDVATGYEYDIQRTFKKDKSSRIQLTGQRREHGKV